MTQSDGGATPLRFVVLCDDTTVEKWQADTIRQAIGSGAAELAGVVVRHCEPELSVAERWAKRWRDRKVILWRIFDRFCVLPFSRAVEKCSLENLIQSVPIHLDRPEKVGNFSERLEDLSIEFIRQLRPDFVLRFGYGILKGEILNAARFGLWSYHHGDPKSFRGQPPGFWEVFQGRQTAGVILQVLSDQLDAGRILHEGTFPVTPQSYAKTRDTLYFGGSPFVSRTCRNILSNGWKKIDRPNSIGLGPIYKQPNTRQVVRFARNNVLARLAAVRNYRLTRQSWNCAVVPYPIQVVSGLLGSEQQSRALRAAQWMTPGKDEFYADPFGFPTADAGYRIFFERYSWRDERGEIATSTYDNGEFGAAKLSLDAKTHLSYPYVLRRNGSWVFIPEHSAARDISSFEFDEDGKVQRKQSILPKSELIDTTIIQRDGKYWAFGLLDNHAKNTELHLFHADHLQGPWRPHTLNPIKSNVRSARPAGTPFLHEGRLFRPSQNCSRIYGGSIIVNEVLTLTTEDYEEVEVTSVEPDPDGKYLEGLHTLSAIGDFTLIDGAKREGAFYRATG